MIKEIIFFCPSIEDGGVEKNLFLIANKLSDNFKISVITANKNGAYKAIYTYLKSKNRI